MEATSSAQTMHFKPWLSIWLHPQQTIQKIVDFKPLHRIYLLIVLSGIASGIGGWLSAGSMDSDSFQANVLLSIGYSLLAVTAGALVSSLVLQWIAGLSGDRIPYSHLLAAYCWDTVPKIGFLLLFIVVFLSAVGYTVVLALTSTPSPNLAWIDWVLLLAWLVASFWSSVLVIAALAQVMKCSFGSVILRSIGAGLILAAPALSSLFAFFGDRYVGGGGRIIYQRPGESGSDLASLLVPAAVLVVSLVVLLAMHRAVRKWNSTASSESHEVEADSVSQVSESDTIL